MTETGSQDPWATKEDISDQSLKRLAGFNEVYRSLMDQKEQAEKSLESVKENLKTLLEKDVPTFMDEVGLSKVVLVDGTIVEVNDLVRGHISRDRREEAHEWLESNGFGDIIKAEVVTRFPKGEIEKAKAIMTLIQGEGLSPEIKESVHYQTLNAFIREQIKNERPFDSKASELLGIFIGRQASFKEQK